MKHKNLGMITMMVSSLMLIAICSVQAADTTITDTIDDVSSVDYYTGETIVITSHPEIDVQNLDITQITYTQDGSQVTLTLKVRGDIENRGSIIDLYSEDIFDSLNFVEYDFQLITSEGEYMVSYSNLTGQLNNGLETINLTTSDFTVEGDTLTIRFSLVSAEEDYEELSVTSMFMKVNFTGGDLDPSGLIYLSDICPNPPLEIIEAYAQNIGSVGETIQFNGSVSPLTGQPPYRYLWDFGDQITSMELNPTHTYTKAGTYTYTFTVTDEGDDSVSEQGTITISTEGGGDSDGPFSGQMILFIAILAIIIVVGVVIIIWIIRR